MNVKLIDILVEELPKLGGWPDGIDDIEMLSDGTIYFNGDIAPDNYKLTQCSDGWSRLKSAKDYSNAVTREQYESELAASKRVWDGEGIPPVGTQCEFISNDTSWGTVDVIGIDGDKVVFKPSGETYYGIVPSQRQIFRPIRSEADKKRYEIILQMSHSLRANGSVTEEQLCRLYSDIAAGYIPHIRID